MRKKLTLGFTLIEIIIAIFILGILAGTAFSLIMDSSDTEYLTKVNQDIRIIKSALNEYKLDKFNYPTTEEGLKKLVPKYIKHVPKDPWGNIYLYLSPGERSAVDIFTYGADAKKGGEGINSDLGNWDTD